MNLHRWTLAAVGVGCMLVTSPALAQEFKPFTEVKNVCPNCPEHGYDTVILKSGTKLKVRVLAQNPQFHVLERHGELRAVGNDQIKEVQMGGEDVRRETGHDDQILLKNGHVLSGKIVREREDTGMFEMKREKFAAQFAYKSQVAVVYKGGKVVFKAD